VNCIDLVELITEYLDGALAPEARDRVDEHLAGCDGCSAYLEQMRTTIRLTGMLTEDQVTAEARSALLEAFRTVRSA
jgi:anti-sigma factor RsiW